MAHQWRQQRVQDGDLADPWDWINLNKHLAEEFNGRLDRDNLPQDAIDNGLIKPNAFNEVYRNGSSFTAPLGGDVGGWYNKSTAGTVLQEVAFTLTSDAMAIIRWSGTWGFSATTAYQGIDNDDEWVEFRIVVDGAEIARHPRSSMARGEWGGGIVGAIALAPGPHVVGLEYMTDTDTDSSVTSDIILKERSLLIRLRKA